MAVEGSDPSEPARKPGGKTLVIDGAARRPFMRGIMVHTLQSKGLSFDEAYGVASAVRERIRGRADVTRDELRALVAELAGPAAAAETRREPARGSYISVTARGRGTPFSKGFLSQSLLAAAIDPSQAFDVAREIEEDLLQRGVREIDRHELRRLAYRAVHERVGAQAAERYLVWRRYQEPDKPVIVLLGGATGAGKTALAQEVAHRLGVAGLVSTDAIRQIMRLMLSQDLAPAIHASSYDAWRHLPDLAGSEDPVIDGFRAMASTVSVGVRALLDRAVAENSSLILDGVSLVPGLLDLQSYEHRAHVIFLLVATLDPEAFATRFHQRARTAAMRGPHRYLENLDAILRIQDYLLELGEQHGVPIVDNVSFDRSVTSIIRHVTETLRKKGDFDAAALL
ncbi:MAG TPA: ATP cone domain-containing protein [Myxococcota bacterium]|jgi:2-phosphoglycerate kinase|nr:ATP cone domain-containing protein [Myxococcota bacterium]